MKRILSFCLAILLVVSLGGCAPKQQKFHYQFFDTFDTIIQVVGYAKTQQEFNTYTEFVHERFRQLNDLFDKFEDHGLDNGIAAINAMAGIAPVKAAQEVLDLVQFSLQWQRETDGAVDITMGAVISIWQDYIGRYSGGSEEAVLPPQQELEAAAQLCGSHLLEVDEQAGTVYLKEKGASLDVGAVAKGYATELISQMLLESEMPSFIISAGGNVRLGNPPLDGRKGWGVGIQDPDGAVLGLSDIVETLFIANTSVVTSGDYQRFYTVDGVNYHHLIDPDTLMPGKDFRAVSIITEDSGLADMLSTAAFLMPYDESRAFVDSLEGVDAIWLFPDGSKKYTFGAMNIAKSYGATNN